MPVGIAVVREKGSSTKTPDEKTHDLPNDSVNLGLNLNLNLNVDTGKIANTLRSFSKRRMKESPILEVTEAQDKPRDVRVERPNSRLSPRIERRMSLALAMNNTQHNETHKKLKFVNKDLVAHIAPPIEAESFQDSLLGPPLNSTSRIPASYAALGLDSITETNGSGRTLESVINRTDDKDGNERQYDMGCKSTNQSFEVRTKYFPFTSSQIYKLVVVKDQTVYQQLIKEQMLGKYERMLLASISHEIRNPLQAINGYLTLLYEARDPAAVQALAENLSRSTEQIDLIVTGACDLMLSQSKDLHIHTEEFALAGLIETTVNVLRPSLEAKALAFKTILDKSLPTRVSSAPKKYQLILFHLLQNAIKYTREGEITIEVYYDRNSGLIETSVRDTGSGISREKQAKLFELYANVETANELNPQGMGLGLTLCKRLSQAMGGDISCRSIVGSGSNLTFTIKDWKASPADKSTTDQIAETDPINCDRIQVRPKSTREIPGCKTLQDDPQPLPNTNVGKVLIVDDEPACRYVLKSYLKSINIQTEEADNGLKALEIVEQRAKESAQPYRLILMDINMPVMDGNQATEKLQRLFTERPMARAPIVAVTAAYMSSQDDYQQMLSAGFADICKLLCYRVVSKPISRADFLAKIKEYI